MKASNIRPCRNAAWTPRNIDDEAVIFLNEQGGFTLIELLVGLALGLIASLAIFSTVSTFETQRRTTGGGADMQQNGLLALYAGTTCTAMPAALN
jgi:prepilin-type N-terminal cleavage/methylation domain-containing protein